MPCLCQDVDSGRRVMLCQGVVNCTDFTGVWWRRDFLLFFSLFVALVDSIQWKEQQNFLEGAHTVLWYINSIYHRQKELSHQIQLSKSHFCTYWCLSCSAFNSCLQSICEESHKPEARCGPFSTFIINHGYSILQLYSSVFLPVWPWSSTVRASDFTRNL